MKFYRSISTIKAITFDLDDTLYDNTTVVENAELKLIEWLNQVEGLSSLTLSQYYDIKKAVLAHTPEIYHDVIVWRRETIKSLLLQTNLQQVNLKQTKLPKTKLPQSEIQNIVDDSMSLFTEYRHKITVPHPSHELLTYLASKYPLAVISNGNVKTSRIGLGGYFQFSLRGGADGRSKPFPEIFNLAAQKLSIATHQIFHVGDSLFADVNGAIKSGMQSCWLNNINQDIKHLPEARCLPHIEISQLPELYNLL